MGKVQLNPFPPQLHFLSGFQPEFKIWKKLLTFLKSAAADPADICFESRTSEKKFILKKLKSENDKN